MLQKGQVHLDDQEPLQ